MSAPNYAITVYQEYTTEMTPNKKYAKTLRQGAHCQGCGWRGTVGDLLCDQKDPSPPTNDFWCPQCKGKAWIFD